MRPELLEQFAQTLNALPFVRWDRCVEAPMAGANYYLVVYGWIDRVDGRSDFVTVEFASWEPLPIPTTSSAKYSKTIAALCGHDVRTHLDCERVEDVFGDLVTHAIALEATP